MPRSLTQLVLALAACMTASCGGDDAGSSAGAGIVAQSAGQLPDPRVSRATLRKNVVLVKSSRAKWTTAIHGPFWTLQNDPPELSIGSLLLLHDAAVEVTSIQNFDGRVLIGVVDVGAEKLFDRIAIDAPFDSQNASFLRTPSSTIATAVHDITSTSQGPYELPLQSAGLDGSLSVTTQGRITYAFDAANESDSRGELQFTTDLLVSLVLDPADEGTSSAGIALGTLLIPISLRLFDDAGVPVGLHQASLTVPISLAIALDRRLPFRLAIDGHTRAVANMRFGPGAGPVLDPPTLAGSVALRADHATDTAPEATLPAIDIGPRIRFQPGLELLSTKPVFGLDLTMAVAANGDLSVIPGAAGPCLHLKPGLSGSTNAIGSTPGLAWPAQTPVANALSIGVPISIGDCPP
ncbi:MAG: hypothetical protein R3E83_17755 [Burkholderiaceae bacterium]